MLAIPGLRQGRHPCLPARNGYATRLQRCSNFGQVGVAGGKEVTELAKALARVCEVTLDVGLRQKTSDRKSCHEIRQRLTKQGGKAMGPKSKFMIAAGISIAGLLVVALAMAAAEQSAEEGAALTKMWPADYFNNVHAQTNDYAFQKYGSAWDFEDGSQERISSMSLGISQARVADGKLKFTLSENKGLITWGAFNRTGKITTEEWIELPNEGGWVFVAVRVKQSKELSKWDIRTHLKGQDEVPSYWKNKGQRELKGTNWQTLVAEVKIPGDALGLEIESEPGNEMEIDSVAVYTVLYLGYYRKTFDLPEGKAWKAVMNISRPGMEADVYVNGESVYQKRVIPDGGWNFWQRTAYNPMPVEITPYLKPGKNVIAVYGERFGYPPSFLVQGVVNMANGTRVTIKTDKTWKWSGAEQPGWNQAEFDDAGWKPIAGTGRPAFCYMKADRDKPYYDGFLQIKNPYRKKLHYKAKETVKFLVEVPAFFAGRALPLNYEIECLTSTCLTSAGAPLKGAVEKGVGGGDNLVYEFNVGQLTPGIYRARFSLANGQEADGLGPRQEEFAVVGPIAQPEVAGNSYEEGMDLELEDTIDCTNPKDPHPFYDADGKQGSLIKEQGKLKYRETQPYDTYFAYAIKFKEVGTPYLIAVDYPDDRERIINFSVQTIRDNYVPYIKATKLLDWDVTTPGYICGGCGRFPLSGQMKTAKFLHWTRTPEAALNIENHTFGFEKRAAAAAQIRIYRVKQLPALKVACEGGRLFGMGTEWGDIIGNTFWTNAAHAQTRFPDSQAEWYGVLENFIKYLRFSGQNLVNLGAWMYNDARYYPDRQVDDSSLEEDYRHLLLEMFGENGISMLAGIEYCYSHGFPSVYYASDKQVAEEGRDTVWSMDNEGRQNRMLVAGGPQGTVNSFHPKVQEEILRVTDELLNKFKDYPAFKGLAFHIFPGIYAPGIGMDSWRSGAPPITWGYEDVTIAAFEKDTGVNIPVEKKDPERFKKRYEWLMANSKEQWIAWRCQKIFELEKKIFEHVKQARPDLLLVNNLAIYECYSKQLLKTGQPAREFLREMGYDPDLYKNVKDLYFSRYQFQLLSHFSMGKPQDQYANFAWADNREVDALFDREESRGYCMQMPFDEYSCPETNAQDWPWKVSNFAAQNAHNIAWPAPGHEHFKAAYTRALIECDPDLVTFCIFDGNTPVGHEQEMREFARVLRALPMEKFRRITGQQINPNVVVKELRQGDQYYFCVLNPGWWPVTVQLTLTGLSDATGVTDLVTGTQVKCPDGKLSISLGPYDARVFCATGQAQLSQTEAAVTGKDAAASLQTRADDIRRMLADPLARELLDSVDLKYCEQRLTEAVSASQAGNLQQANALISDWKLNRLVSGMDQVGLVAPWYVIGPFSNDREGKGFFTAYAVEQDVLAKGEVDEKKEYQGAAGPVQWRKTCSTVRGGHQFVDFDEIFYPNEWVCAYAFRKIMSGKQQEAVLSMGSDDGLKVWLNGKEVISKYIARGAQPGQDQVKVVLEEGENRLLLKVEEQIGGWGFYQELLGPDGQLLNLTQN